MQAQVTIGIPVYNGAATVARALRSLLDQTYPHFTIRISDNASTDDTIDRCRDCAAGDPRMTIVRQPNNLGAVQNFRGLLERVDTPYFMFAAADDRWEPDFLAETVAALEADPDAVASVSRVDFERDGRVTRMSGATAPLQGDTRTNLRHYLRDPADNSRFYALYRSAPLVDSFPSGEGFHGFDWAITALTLLHGKHLEVPQTLLHREDSESHRYNRLGDTTARGGLERWFPTLAMSRFLLRRLPPGYGRAVAGPLLALNVWQFWQYACFRLRGLPLIGPLGRLVLRLPGARALLTRRPGR